jgi:putative serine protease PepD
MQQYFFDKEAQTSASRPTSNHQPSLQSPASPITKPLPEIVRANHGALIRRRSAALLVALALLGGAVGGGVAGAAATNRWYANPAPLAEAIAPAASAPLLPSTSVAGEVYRQVGGSVVEVAVRGTQGGGMGSGVIIDRSGMIVTNNHVVGGARSITVRFANGATAQATLLRTDPANDLALLQAPLPSDVVVAKLGDSARVQVGDPVVAIGNPFGLEQTVTQGIISAVQRDWRRNGPQNLIQTDAPINPGNSGGPLFNAAGEVVGINTLIASPVRGSVGIGFAVPVNTARQLITP